VTNFSSHSTPFLCKDKDLPQLSARTAQADGNVCLFDCLSNEKITHCERPHNEKDGCVCAWILLALQQSAPVNEKMHIYNIPLGDAEADACKKCVNSKTNSVTCNQHNMMQKFNSHGRRKMNRASQQPNK
jgi:hypothetical protein